MSQPWIFRCILPDPQKPDQPCGVSPPATFTEPQEAGGEWRPPKVTAVDPWHWMMRHLIEVHGVAVTDLDQAKSRVAGPNQVILSLGSGPDFLEGKAPEPQPGPKPGFLKQFSREG